MKNLVLITTLFVYLITYSVYSQHYKTRSGTIEFEASVSGFEEVKANTNAVSVIMDSASGSLASLVLINGFQFKVGLMQEHFNENYMESTIYPKATFKGDLQNFNLGELSNIPQTYRLIGDLTIHGITKKVKVDCQLKLVEDVLSLSGKFIVSPGDYEIDIPKLVTSKIAKEIQISFNYKLEL